MTGRAHGDRVVDTIIFPVYCISLRSCHCRFRTQNGPSSCAKHSIHLYAAHEGQAHAKATSTTQTDVKEPQLRFGALFILNMAESLISANASGDRLLQSMLMPTTGMALLQQH